MPSLIRSAPLEPSHPARTLLPLVVIMAFLLGLLLLLPGDIAAKSHVLLHGVCAQRPSHTLYLGDAALPVDARMTGIYLGALVTGLWLLTARRFHARRTPSRSVMVALALLVGAMAFDGTNALLSDLGFPNLYEPTNSLRLATGLLAGVALGTGAAHLFAMSVWRHGDSTCAVVNRPRELSVPLALSALAAAPMLSGLAVFHAPYTVVIVVGVVAVFWQFATPLLVLARHGGLGMASERQLGAAGAWGLAISVLSIAILALARLAAERYLGLPNLT